MKTFLATCAALLLTCATALASTYVGNSNTGKFHFANCSAVDKMNPAHRVVLNSRDEAIASGFVPCKRCKP